jgi:adenylate kinase family enzyme
MVIIGNPIVLFLVGPPGAGKTTLARTLLGEQLSIIEKPKWTIGNNACAAGHYTGQTFDGADTVPYNGVNDALEYWKQNLTHLALTILDGDRFSNLSTLDYFLKWGYAHVKAIHLSCSDDELSRRRVARGSNQNATWIKGRVTKAKNFAAMIQGTLSLDSTETDLHMKVMGYLL